MKELEDIIESFNDWSKPWIFYKFIINNNKIPSDQKNYFKQLYKEVSEFKLWNNSDLNVSINNCTALLTEKSNLRQKSIDQIINTIAYEWR